VLNCLLIPKWGAVGCCVAALVSQYICAVSVYIFATRTNNFQHDAIQFLKLAFIALLLSTLFYFGKQYASPLVLAVAGACLVLLALFAYLPHVKRSLILSR
jgi:O-antigen/teichoic acid export membrane protein